MLESLLLDDFHRQLFIWMAVSGAVFWTLVIVGFLGLLVMALKRLFDLFTDDERVTYVGEVKRSIFTRPVFYSGWLKRRA